jgi:hypothetical protein
MIPNPATVLLVNRGYRCYNFPRGTARYIRSLHFKLLDSPPQVDYLSFPGSSMAEQEAVETNITAACISNDAGNTG